MELPPIFSIGWAIVGALNHILSADLESTRHLTTFSSLNGHFIGIVIKIVLASWCFGSSCE